MNPKQVISEFLTKNVFKISILPFPISHVLFLIFTERQLKISRVVLSLDAG